MESNTVARYYAARNNFLRLTQTAGVLILKDDCLIFMDHYYESEKERFLFAEFTADSISVDRQNDVTIKTGKKTAQYTITYVTDFLSDLYYLLHSARVVLGEEEKLFVVSEKNRLNEVIPWNIIVTTSTVMHIDPAANAVRSTEDIKDVVELLVVQDDPAGLVLRWRNDTSRLYSIKEGKRDEFITTIQKNGARLLCSCEVTYDTMARVELMLQRLLQRSPETYAAYEVRHVQPGGTLLDAPLRTLCLTKSGVMLCDPQARQTLFVIPVSLVYAVLLPQDDPTLLVMHFKHGLSLKFSTPNPEVIVSGVLALASAYNRFCEIPIMFEYTVPGTRIDPPYAEHVTENEGYYLKKLQTAVEKPDAFTAGAQAIEDSLFELNSNLPLVGLLTQNRRILPAVLQMLKYRPISEKIVVRGLGAFTRLMSSLAVFQEVGRSFTPDDIKAVTGLLVDPNPRISTMAALALRAMVRQNFEAPVRMEQANRKAVLSDDVVRDLTELVVRYSSTPTHVLLVHTVMSIIETCVRSRVLSTPNEVTRSLLIACNRMVPQLHSLCRSPGLGVIESAQEILRTVLESARSVEGGELLRDLQDDARQSAAIVGHVTTGLFDPAVKTRYRAIALVNLMSDGNTETTELLDRIFPRALVRTALQKEFQPITLPTPPRTGQWPPEPVTRVPSAPVSGPRQWDNIFAQCAQNVMLPHLIWDDRTRRELLLTLESQHNEFINAQQVAGGKLMWNHQEFEIKYGCLEEEMPVGEYFLRPVLSNEEIALENPQAFVEQVTSHLVLSPDAEVRVACLRCLIWAFRTGRSLGAFRYVGSVVFLLRTCNDRIVRDQILILLRELFTLRTNIRAFVDAPDALGQLMAELSAVHGAAVEPTTATRPLDRISVGKMCVELLSLAATLVPSQDQQSRKLLFPTPKIKVELSRKENLQYLIQCLLVNSTKEGSSELIDVTTLLLDMLLRFTDTIVPHLYRTGLFLFAAMYDGPNVSSIAALYELLHTRQAFNPVEVGLPEPQESVLCNLYPDTLIRVLTQQGAEAFARALTGDVDTPTLVWNQAMRSRLVLAVRTHLANFLRELASQPRTFYEYVPMRVVSYPQLEAELRVGPFYIRNLVDPRYKGTVVDDPIGLMEGVMALFNRQPPADTLLLLLKAQVMLFQSYARTAPFRNYTGFAVLLPIIRVTPTAPLVLADLERRGLAAELALAAVMSSDENLAAFVEGGGVNAVASLYAACIRVAPRNPMGPLEPLYLLLLALLRVFVRVSGLEAGRVSMDRERTTVGDLVYTAVLPTATLADAALNCMVLMAATPSLQNTLYDHGAVYVAVDAALKYDARKVATVEQEALRSLAHWSIKLLGVMAGMTAGEGVAPSPASLKVLAALKATLNTAALLKLRALLPNEFSAALLEDQDTPAVIWNRETRAELAGLVARKIKLVFDSCGEAVISDKDVLAWEYEALRKELRVEGIFIRIYNAMPAWPVDPADGFMAGLLARAQTEAQALAALDPNGRDAEGVLIRLAALMQAAVHLLQQQPSLMDAIAAMGRFPLLFSLLDIRARNNEICARTLQLLVPLSGNERCIAAMSQTSTIVVPLVKLIRAVPAQMTPVLQIMQNFALRSDELVRELRTSGGMLYVMEQFVDPEREDVRKMCTTILAGMVSNGRHGAAMTEVLAMYWPPVFLNAFPTAPYVTADRYHKSCEHPDLIWHDKIRAGCRTAIQQELSAFEARSRGSTPVEWVPAGIDIAVREPQLELKVAGIYVRVFNQFPTWPLTDPAGFGLGLMQALSECVLADQAATLAILIALTHVFKGRAAVVTNVAENMQRHHFEALLRVIEAQSPESRDAQRIVLTVLDYLIRHKRVVKEFAVLPFVRPFVAMVTSTQVLWSPGLLLLLRLVRANQLYVHQLMEAKLLSKMLDILNSGALAATKQYAACIVKTVVETGAPNVQEEARAIVRDRPLWAEFENVSMPVELDEDYDMMEDAAPVSRTAEATLSALPVSMSGSGTLIPSASTPNAPAAPSPMSEAASPAPVRTGSTTPGASPAFVSPQANTPASGSNPFMGADAALPPPPPPAPAAGSTTPASGPALPPPNVPLPPPVGGDATAALKTQAPVVVVPAAGSVQNPFVMPPPPALNTTPTARSTLPLGAPGGVSTPTPLVGAPTTPGTTTTTFPAPPPAATSVTPVTPATPATPGAATPTVPAPPPPPPAGGPPPPPPPPPAVAAGDRPPAQAGRGDLLASIEAGGFQLKSSKERAASVSTTTPPRARAGTASQSNLFDALSSALGDRRLSLKEEEHHGRLQRDPSEWE